MLKIKNKWWVASIYWRKFIVWRIYL